jgi:hypothetical protein
MTLTKEAAKKSGAVHLIAELRRQQDELQPDSRSYASRKDVSHDPQG